MLDSSLAAAFDTLADQRVFPLDEAQWAAFMEALDTPPERLRASYWQRKYPGNRERDGGVSTHGTVAARARPRPQGFQLKDRPARRLAEKESADERSGRRASHLRRVRRPPDGRVLQPSPATGSVRHNTPDPVPIALLGRLAVEHQRQGKGLGLALLRDAILRVVGAAETIGVRAILMHAISDEVRAFYEHWGFRPSPVEPMTLMITIDEARRMLGKGRLE